MLLPPPPPVRLRRHLLLAGAGDARRPLSGTERI